MLASDSACPDCLSLGVIQFLALTAIKTTEPSVHELKCSRLVELAAMTKSTPPCPGIAPSLPSHLLDSPNMCLWCCSVRVLSRGVQSR